MKIAYIALKDMPYIGGVEKYTEEIGERLVKDGHEVVVYVTAKIPCHKKYSYNDIEELNLIISDS